MIADLRVCFAGDSFVAGVGDPDHLGWAGRVVARTHRAGQPLTAYKLGIRRNTSDDVLARWHAECSRRLPAQCTGAVVFSFGVNDTVVENGRQRVDPDRAAANLATLLAQAGPEGWPVLVVGPPPIADDRQNDRTAGLNEAFRRICAAEGTGYVDVFDSLRADRTWMLQVERGDGAHPAAEGYGRYADLVWPHWSTWVSGLPS